MNLLKKVTLFGLILSISISQPAHALTVQDIKNGIKTVTLCASAAIATYTIARGSSYGLFQYAKYRFNKDIHHLKNNDLNNLYLSITGHYNQKVDTLNITHNKLITLYPHLSHKNDLDWYINRLWCLQIFHLGTDTRIEMQSFITALENLRRLIVSSPIYNEELRKYYDSRQ